MFNISPVVATYPAMPFEEGILTSLGLWAWSLIINKHFGLNEIPIFIIKQSRKKAISIKNGKMNVNFE